MSNKGAACYTLEKVAQKNKIMDHKIKNYLGIAGIVGILIAAIVAWQFAATYADSIQPGAYRTFSVAGDGKTIAIPDVATFTFSVITQGGKDLGTLQTQNTNYANSVIEYLKGQGVDPKDIKTQNYDVAPRYQYSNCGYGSGSSTCPPPVIVGYTITQTVSVKVRNLSKAGEIVGGVVQSGANSVSQLTFTLDSPDAAKAAARAEAMAKARAKAELIAKEGGFGIGRLISVQVNEGGQYPYPMYGLGGGMAVSKAEVAPAPTVEPGSQEVNVTVNLVYEIR